MLGGQRTVFLQNGAWQFDARARHMSVIHHHALHATSSDLVLLNIVPDTTF